MSRLAIPVYRNTGNFFVSRGIFYRIILKENRCSDIIIIISPHVIGSKYIRGNSMDAFTEYIEKKCEDALYANKEYREMQIKSNEAYKRNDIEQYNECAMRMLVIAENVSYKLAIKDALSLLIEN